MRISMVCSHCGSTEVLRDAYAEWDVETQQWELHSVFDNAICQSETCDGGETHIEEKEIGDDDDDKDRG
jgi:hypothetical protein